MSDALGSRNTTLFALAKELHARNLTDKGVRDRVMAANDQFKDPLTFTEINVTILEPLAGRRTAA
jgi:starvation-inducible outer membrane lipoprotein